LSVILLICFLKMRVASVPAGWLWGSACGSFKFVSAYSDKLVGLLDNVIKAFHFMEVDWLICFPRCGNQGKYLSYNVAFKDRKRGETRLETWMSLGELLDKPEICENFPHTVGYFKVGSGEAVFKPEYLEIRIIRSVEDFWAFLNSLDI
jgi:hypothetical protein